MEPDNPLGLDDETIVRLFNTGKTLQQVAQMATAHPWNPNIVFHSVDEMYANYINRDELGNDPFSSGKLRLERLDNKVRLYSVGPDGEWNGGQLVKPGDSEMRGDVGVEMENGKNDVHWLAEGATLDYLQGKHTARYLARRRAPSAAPGPAAAPAENRLKFGPVVDGLQAALELITTNGGFAYGRPIDVRFHIRNAANYPIQIASDSWREGDDAIIEDERGLRREGGLIWYSGVSLIRREVVQPGQTIILKSSSLALFSPDDKRRPDAAVSHLVGYTAKVKPGKCTVRFRLGFPGWNAQLMDWQGQLETGPVTVDVQPPSDSR